MNDQNEERIISALESYHPIPGPQFYHRMSSSPWYRKKWDTRPSHLRSIATGIAAFLIAVIALSMAIPSARAAVLKYLGLTVSESETVPNPAISVENLVDIRKVDEISSLAGWDIKIPTWLPEGYQFLDAQYVTTDKMVLLTFIATRQLPGDDPTMTETRAITMVQALHNDVLPLMVAPTTNILDVTINGHPAAYATGAWENDATTGMAAWNSSYALKNVYWQIENVYLTLNTSDELVSKEDLLKIAESTK